MRCLVVLATANALQQRYFASTARGCEPYLADELRRGTTEAELYNYLKRVLPPSERTLERIERLIGQARQRVQ